MVAGKPQMLNGCQTKLKDKPRKQINAFSETSSMNAHLLSWHTEQNLS